MKDKIARKEDFAKTPKTKAREICAVRLRPLRRNGSEMKRNTGIGVLAKPL